MRYLFTLLLFTLPTLAQPLSSHDPAWLQSTSPLRVGLLTYYRLEEASGIRYDCSNNGNHIGSNNSVGQGTGVQTKCATFALGASQYLSGATNTLLLNSFPVYTMAFWVNLTTTNTVQIFASRDLFSANHREYGSYWDTTGFAPGFYIGDGGNNVDAIIWGSQVSAANWHFVTCGRSNATTFISVDNGALQTKSFSLTPANYTNIFCMGRYGGTPGLYLNGSMDEFGIWSRALTSSERTQLYNSGRGTHFPWAHP